MVFDPSRHPRWPAAAPDSHGGEFRDSTASVEYALFKTDGRNWLRSLSRRISEGRHRPGQWSLEDPDAYHKQQLQHLRDHGLQTGVPPHQVRQLVAEVAARTEPPAVVLANGPHRLVFQDEVDDYGAVSEMFDRLIRVSPISNPARVIFARGIPDGNQGSTLYPTPTILVDTRVFGEPVEDELAISMPVARSVPWWQYVMAHEWGHVRAGELRMPRPEMPSMDGMSPYGSAPSKYPGMEAYAEAHAEWFLTGGQTSNPATVAAARKWKWGRWGTP